MTPRSFTRTPSVSAEDVSEPAASEYDSGDESLPPHTSEIGTLKKLPNHGTAWLGSSSGVYFVNTVRRAFSAALVDANTTNIPASEDILTGEDADGRNYNGPMTDGPSMIEGDFRRVVRAALGRPPSDRALAMELVTTFFRCWHPLFPFMHGPRFLQDIDAIYSMDNASDTGTFTPAEARRVVTFQLIINIASLDRRDIHLPNESRIKATVDVTRVAGCFCVHHDIAAIQLLIAAELYLVATIALRQASTVAGMILKLIYHAGLHRCPLRYAQLSLEDCEIRKRIFWSAYALDRHLSLSLGDPNTVQDSDIDVCLSGRELHKAVAHELIVNAGDELKMHLPTPHSGPHGSGSPSDDPRVVNLNDGPHAREKAQREAAMTAYVHYGKLTGRIIEIFHKSIHARFQKPDAITFLNSDIETWWNDLPSTLTNLDDEEDENAVPKPNQATSPTHEQSQSQSPSTSTQTGTSSSPTHKQLAPFFLILYHQLQLLLNRPRLSLDQSSAEFQHGLQVCIKASRNTLTALKKHRDNGQSMLLPGLLSASWMAGLIIAFACQLGKYPKMRACSDITTCLTLLESMGSKDWFTIKNCHKVLSLLLANIRARKASASGFLSTVQPSAHTHGPSSSSQPVKTEGIPISRKRAHDEGPSVGGPASATDVTASPKRKSMAGSGIGAGAGAGVGEISQPSPANSSDSRMPPPPTATLIRHQSMKRSTGGVGHGNEGLSANMQPLQQIHQSDWQNTVAHSRTHSNSPSESAARSPYLSNAGQLMYPTSINSPSYANPIANVDTTNLSTAGSALYADPSELAFAQSSHSLNLPTSLPGQSLDIDDPSFWGNFDYNISDVFGAASWETLTGGMAGGSGNSGLFGGFNMGGHPSTGWGNFDNESNIRPGNGP